MEKDKDKLEEREFIIEDEMGNIIGDLSLISFVSDPAIKQNFQLFSANKYIFAKTDKEKMEVTGPAMRANHRILRQDPKTGEYFYCYFTEEQIRKASQIFMKNSNHTRTNLEHGELAGSNQVKGVYVFESWIVEDPATDKATKLGFKEVNKGDWYVTFKVEDDMFWKFLKENGGGFSIEGMFAHKFAKVENENVFKREVITETAFADDITKEEKKDIIEAYAFLSVSDLTFDDYPKAAKNNAAKVLRWIDEKGRDEVQGATKVGLARANQLAGGEPISYDTVKRMASFNRHRANSKIDAKFKGTPWKDKGYVAWLAWGGDAGVDWAIRKVKEVKRKIKEQNN